MSDGGMEYVLEQGGKPYAERILRKIRRKRGELNLMGHKIPFDDAQKLCGIDKQDESIFAKPNKYNYKININHRLIRPLYERYKRSVGETILSDRQRFEFESIIFDKIRPVMEKNKQGEEKNG